MARGSLLIVRFTMISAIVFSVLWLAFSIAKSDDTKKLRLGLITPHGHIWTEAALDFSTELRKKTNGRLDVAVYPSRQLGNEAQLMQLLQTGALDMAILTAAEISNRAPSFGALYAPFLATDVKHAAAILEGKVATDLLASLKKEVGVIGLGYTMGGLRQILTRDRYEEIGNFVGTKIRTTPFEPIRDFYSLIGAAPTPMPLSAVYDALGNGQIDAVDMDFEATVVMGYAQLVDTVVVSNHMMFPTVGVMSLTAASSVPVQDRVLIETLFKKHLQASTNRAIQQEAIYLERLKSQGVRIVFEGPHSFAPYKDQWLKLWRHKAVVIDDLYAEAQALKDGSK